MERNPGAVGTPIARGKLARAAASLFSVACLLAVALLARDIKPARSFFPLTEGTYWVYEGSVTWFDADKKESMETKVSLKMTVEKVFRKDDTTYAVIDGFPSDLNFSTGDVKPTRWVLIEKENGKNEVFLHDLEPGVTLPAEGNPAPTFAPYMTDDNLLLEWPMVRGNKFCDPDSQKRDDKMYCWIVEAGDHKAVHSVNGVSPASVPVFTLQYRTNPDDTQIEYSPGIGILSYRYHHHGTTADTSLKLQEFHPAPEKMVSSGSPS